MEPALEGREGFHCILLSMTDSTLDCNLVSDPLDEKAYTKNRQSGGFSYIWERGRFKASLLAGERFGERFSRSHEKSAPSPIRT